jgi:Fur family peroxide stress response transcriptional regulator
MVKERGNRERKRSRQRERILELLQGTGAHPTADWLYDRLKGEFPNLSMGTVYRNLNILVEQGLINRIDCEKCGAIIDLPLPIDEALNRRVDEATPFAVSRHRIEFYGTCDRCRGAEKR